MSTTILSICAVFGALAAYAFVAAVLFRAIVARLPADADVLGFLAAALWPIGLPILAGVWLAAQARDVWGRR